MTEGRSRHRRIRLVAGPPGAGPHGIEDSFVASVRQLKSGDPLAPVIVLAGSNPLRLHLSRLLAVKLGGHANIRFLLLRDLARELGTAPLAAKGRRRLPEFGRDLLLREAVRPWAHGTYFQGIATREGFLEAVGATIRDLKEAEIEPAVLRATAAGLRQRGDRRRAGSGDALLAGKLEDLSNLYEAYDELLRDRRFYDEEDLMKAAAGAAVTSGGTPPAALVYGFYDLNGLQRSLVREWLSFRAGAVFVPFEPAERAGEDWDYGAPLLDWMATWIPERTTLPPPRDAATGAGEADVRYVSVPGESREAVEAVRWLAGIGRERSLPFGHLALLYRNPEPYARLLPEIFDRAEKMPWYGADGIPLSRGQAARALLLLLQAGERGLERRAVLDALVVAGEPRAAEWDRLSREAGITAGGDVWAERLGRLPGEGASSLARRVAELDGCLKQVPTAGRWSEFVAAVIALVERFVSDGIPREGLIDRLGGLTALDEVDTPVNRDRFLSILTRALDSWVEPPGEHGHFQRSGIFVGSVMDARLLSFHAVAMLGMVERSFPAPPRQDPILLDEEREMVNGVLGSARLPLKAAGYREERLLFRMARSTAQEALALFYPRIDAAARPRMASPFLLALEKEICGRPVGFGELESSPRMHRVPLSAMGPQNPSEAIVSREFDLAALQAASRAGGDAGAGRRLASFLHAHPLLHRALQAEEARWESSRFTAHDGVIMKASLLEELARLHPVRGRPVSPSAVEDYATCPLKYLFDRVLHLSRLPDPAAGEGLNPMRRGQLIHAILERLYSRMKERGWLPLDAGRLPQSVRLLKEVAAQRFAEEERAAPVGYPLLWEIERRGIVRDLETALRKEAEGAEGWRPTWFELPFGPPVALEIRPGQVIELKGRIDRVDLSGDGRALRVTDYKTGALPAATDARLGGGTRVQIPLYLLAAEQALAAEHPGVRATHGRYLSVSRRGAFKETIYDAAALAEDRPELARILGTVLREIERGRFFACPEDSVCGRCDFQLACGEGREARFARKRDDRIAAEYLAMREGRA